MLKIITIVIITFMFASCSAPKSTPTQVGKVDLEKYTGIWYEIGSFPASFQRGCHCTTAEYQLTGKRYIRVINRCRKNSTDGKESSIRGRAYPVQGSNNTKLKVQFFWPFRGDYHIIMLADDYSWAVVVSGTKYLWILNRSQMMDEKLFEEITIKLTAEGFDMGRLQRTEQACG